MSCRVLTEQIQRRDQPGERLSQAGRQATGAPQSTWRGRSWEYGTWARHNRGSWPARCPHRLSRVQRKDNQGPLVLVPAGCANSSRTSRPSGFVRGQDEHPKTGPWWKKSPPSTSKRHSRQTCNWRGHSFPEGTYPRWWGTRPRARVLGKDGPMLILSHWPDPVNEVNFPLFVSTQPCTGVPSFSGIVGQRSRPLFGKANRSPGLICGHL